MMKSETSSKSRLLPLKRFKLRSLRALSFNFYSCEIYERVIEYRIQWPSSFWCVTIDVLLLCPHVLLSFIAKRNHAFNCSRKFLRHVHLFSILSYEAAAASHFPIVVELRIAENKHSFGKLFHQIGRLVFIFTHVDIVETINDSSHVAGNKRNNCHAFIVSKKSHKGNNEFL